MISWEYSEEIPPGLLSHEDARHGSETNLEFHQQAEILRTHMLEAANGKTGRCLVVGAGLCEDVPLEQLVEQFSEVHLLDVRAIRPPVDSDKVELHQEDISSVVTMTLRELNQLPRAAEPCRQSALAAEALDRCDEPLTGTWEGLGKFDFIASTLVLSQLGRPVQTYLHQQFVPQSALLKQAYGNWLMRVQRFHLHWIENQGSADARFFLSTTPSLQVNGDHVALVDESVFQELHHRFTVLEKRNLSGWHSHERHFQPVTFSLEQK